jgi:hypothetical protein
MVTDMINIRKSLIKRERNNIEYVRLIMNYMVLKLPMRI